MEFIRAFMSKKKPAVRSEKGETIQVPYLGDMNDVRGMPVPGSGMDRADWFAEGIPRPDVKSDSIPTSSSKKNKIGSNQRGINGAVRGEEWGGDYYTGYIKTTFSDPKTRESDDLESFWKTQVGSSKGLNVPGEDQVYVDQDTQSVWA